LHQNPEQEKKTSPLILSLVILDFSCTLKEELALDEEYYFKSDQKTITQQPILS